MGYLYTIIISAILSLTNQVEVPFNDFEKAFKANNASQIVALGKDKLLINVLGKEGAYSQQQSILILKEFFTKKPGNEFVFIHKGKETNDSSFGIGNYTSKDEKFRVTIHFKKISNDYKIESLAIEKI